MTDEWKTRPLTPNVKTLGIHFATLSVKSLADGIDFITFRLDTEMPHGFKLAFESIDAVRNAREPNPYKDMTDEEIAKVILDGVDKRTRGRIDPTPLPPEKR